MNRTQNMLVSSKQINDSAQKAHGQTTQQAAIVLWQKMAQRGGGAPPQWLSTHPSSQAREADLWDVSGRVLPLYERVRQGH